MSNDRFDASYYERFYGARPTHTAKQIGQLAAAVTSMASWWRMPIRSVLDVGAGKGYWRTWLAHAMPSVRYHGLDASEHAARRYGHELADIATWRPPRAYDLVVCQSVLQYLDDDAATAALGVLGRACGRLLYLEVPTAWDRDEIIDPERTDMDIHWRTGAWYRARLDEHFLEIGAGLWSKRRTALFFEMEAASMRAALG